MAELKLSASDFYAKKYLMVCLTHPSYMAFAERYAEYRIAELESQLAAITDQRDTLARQCNLNAQGVNAISGIIGERNEYKHELAEARKAAREETLAAVWTYCIDASVECNLECLIESVRNKLAASGNEQRHGECPACTMGQSLERGEGTHREGTRQHPISEKGEKE